MSSVLRLPVGKPSADGATRLQIWRSRARRALGMAATRMGVPGAVREWEHLDPFTGQHLAIHLGSRFVRLSVNGRDYYFDRFTGRFDGTGLGCS